VYEKSETERILFLEGSKENDTKTMKESGKVVDKTSESFKSSSEGLVRGLETVYFETKGDTYILVMRWHPQDAKAIEDIEKGKK
jgi:hypothetical protein